MAGVTKTYPNIAQVTIDTTNPEHTNGKVVTGIEFAFSPGSGTTGLLGQTAAEIAEFMQSLSVVASPLIIGALRDSGSGANVNDRLNVIYEGEFGTDTYDGTNSETFAAYMATIAQEWVDTITAGPLNGDTAVVTAMVI
jgi:hypothetical protein